MPSAVPLKILFVTPECAPWAKTGGLGDVSAALPQALMRLGHDVRVLMPAYRSMRPLLAQAKRRHTWPAEGPWPEAQLAEVEAGGLSLLLLDCPGFYDRHGSPYGDPGGPDFEDGARRFGFLSAVAARLSIDPSPRRGWRWRADVLHANDWPTGLAPAYLGLDRHRQAVSVFTIHNLAFQGMFPVERGLSIGLPQSWMSVDGALHWDQLCLLKAGVRYADAVTTVSPTYAREIQEPEMGFGMDGMMRARAADLHGILNGIDPESWNPTRDPLIVQHFDANSLEGKTVNKLALQHRLGLAESNEPVLFGMVSRLTEQKGVDLVLDNIDWLTEQGHQVVVLGKGEARFEQALAQAAARHPGQVSAIAGFDEGLAHLIEAGSDVFLMPSRFEPCGLNQMYSQAYGTAPIVRATGGLADSVDDAQPGTDKGTGFVFQEPTAMALREALQRALTLRQDGDAWRALQRRGMARRFDWALSAKRYEALYRKLQMRQRPSA